MYQSYTDMHYTSIKRIIFAKYRLRTKIIKTLIHHGGRSSVHCLQVSLFNEHSGQTWSRCFFLLVVRSIEVIDIIRVERKAHDINDKIQVHCFLILQYLFISNFIEIVMKRSRQMEEIETAIYNDLYLINKQQLIDVIEYLTRWKY